MFTFESVETKSNEFRVAYSKLISVIRDRMIADSAFALEVRQAVDQFNHVYSIEQCMHMFTCLLPRRCYKLGRYSNPELYSFKYCFEAGPSGLYDAHVLTYTLYKTVMETLSNLLYISSEEDPVEWFAPFSKCGYWESFSTAIMGVPEWKANEPLWKLRPLRCEEVGRDITVGISPDVRGFVYPFLTLQCLIVQTTTLLSRTIFTPELCGADGIEEYLQVLQSISLNLGDLRDYTVSSIKNLMED